MKLIFESSTELNGFYEDEINESNGNTERNYYISGIFSTPEQKNRNGRVYSRSIWEREVQKYQGEIKKGSYNLLGEWEHPPRSNVDPMKAVIKIVDLKINEDGNVWGKAKILNDNTPETNKLKGLIKEGFKIGVSSRGVGRVSSSGIVEDFKLITYDVVASPSDFNAELNGVVEGYQLVEGIVQGKEFEVNENDCVVECSLTTDLNEEKFNIPGDDLHVIGDLMSQILKGKTGNMTDAERLRLNQLLDKYNLKGNSEGETVKGFVEFIKSKGYGPQNESEEKQFSNVDMLRVILEEKGVEKLCDLTLEDKEEVLSKFKEQILSETAIYKNEDSKIDEEENLVELNDEKALKLIESLKNFINK